MKSDPKPFPNNEFWFKVKAAVNIKPEEYWPYFEDLIFAANAEIEPKGFLGDGFQGGPR